MPALRRSVVLVVILSLITCGLYLVYWYFTVLDELERATGVPPTGHSPWLDFLLALITCGLWGLYVDYRISKTILEIQSAHGLPHPTDTSIGVIVLDVFGLGIVSSAIHQCEMNRAWSTGRW